VIFVKAARLAGRSPPKNPMKTEKTIPVTKGSLIFGSSAAGGLEGVQTALGDGAAPPKVRAHGLPGAVSERFSRRRRRISSRRAVAETWLHRVACVKVLASARALEAIREKREPRRLREAERGPG
jgi:hypothetical protein